MSFGDCIHGVPKTTCRACYVEPSDYGIRSDAMRYPLSYREPETYPAVSIQSSATTCVDVAHLFVGLVARPAEPGKRRKLRIRRGTGLFGMFRGTVEEMEVVVD